MRLRLDLADEDWRSHFQPDVAVDPGIGEIVDRAAERRNFRIFRAVDLHRDQVGAGLEAPGQARGEGGVAVAMRDDFFAVAIDHGIGHGAVKLRG